MLELVELTPLAHALVGSLSVEARKRASVGVELVANPAIVFMDEPTTGARVRVCFRVRACVCAVCVLCVCGTCVAQGVMGCTCRPCTRSCAGA